jgi:hypothetical protein
MLYATKPLLIYTQNHTFINCVQVHFGGKRKSHIFRTLYDYYGRRVDYGDGEWPALWPSEVRQDEEQGWTHNVTPHRSPVNVIGDWEKYVDDLSESSSFKRPAAGTGNGLVWYRNTVTGESSYDDVPPCFRDLQLNESLFSGNNGGSIATTKESVGWEKHYDEQYSIEYYYDGATGESTYDRPDNFCTPAMRHQGDGKDDVALVDSTRQHWTRHFDDRIGIDFYYNDATGDSVYDRPSGFIT